MWCVAAMPLCTSSFCVEVTRKNRGKCSAVEQPQLVVKKKKRCDNFDQPFLSSLCEVANSWQGWVGRQFGDAQYTATFFGTFKKGKKSRWLCLGVNKQSQHKKGPCLQDNRWIFVQRFSQIVYFIRRSHIAHRGNLFWWTCSLLEIAAKVAAKIAAKANWLQAKNLNTHTHTTVVYISPIYTHCKVARIL